MGPDRLSWPAAPVRRQTGRVQIELARSEVRAGESWARAADRLARGRGPVLAVDLTGDPLHFALDEEHRFALRAMSEGDLGDVHRWVNAPHVARWWDDRRTPEQVERHYAPGLRGQEPVRYWVFEVNGRSVGFCQDYRIADHPDYALLCGHPDAVGFDYVVGEAAYVGRGLGTSLLWVHLRDLVVPAYDGVRELFAAPDHRNARSLRVLGKLGATSGLWFDEPRPGGSGEHRRGVQHRRRAGTGLSMTRADASTSGPGAVRIGISGWTYAPWRGDFYPEGLPQRRELEYAASQLSSIEINGSFYSLQRPSSYARWRTEVPDDFCFAVKGGRFITHMKRLQGVEAPLANFFASGVLALGPTLGPVLWQLPATLAYDPQVLGGFLDLLPRTTTEAATLAGRHDDRLSGERVWSGEVEDRPMRHALEPRHASFGSNEARAQLAEAGVALVVADSAGKWPRFEQAVGPFVYVRLHGDEELYASGYSDAALADWAQRLRGWTAAGRDAFVYFDNDMKGYAPHDARRLMALLDG